jgi:AcrR family transcriptional regulator
MGRAKRPKIAGRATRDARGNRREQILAEALRLFAEHGVHTVSTRQIAAAVGVSQPSLYAFFPTKQALVGEVSARAFLALSTRMAEELRRAPPPGALARLGRVYIDFGLTQPDAYRVAFMMEGVRKQAAGDHDGAMAIGLGAFLIFRGAVAEALGAERGAEDIDLMAQSLWASLHGLVSLIIARPNFPWADRRRLIDLHIRRLFPAEGEHGR